MSQKKASSIEDIFIHFNLLSDSDFKSWMLNNYDRLVAMHKAEIVKSSAQGYLMGVNEGFPLETAYNYAQQWYANQFEGGEK